MPSRTCPFPSLGSLLSFLFYFSSLSLSFSSILGLLSMWQQRAPQAAPDCIPYCLCSQKNWEGLFQPKPYENLPKGRLITNPSSQIETNHCAQEMRKSLDRPGLVPILQTGWHPHGPHSPSAGRGYFPKENLECRYQRSGAYVCWGNTSFVHFIY